MLKYIGGVLLCITKHHNQRPVIVLGKELYQNGVYADFGGSKKTYDININDTISREVCEELYIKLPNIDSMLFLDLYPNNKEKYKLCIGYIDGICEKYFNKIFNLNHCFHYSAYSEICKIRKFYIDDLTKIQNNYMYDVYGYKCVIRTRTLKALKNRKLQNLIFSKFNI